LNVILVSVGFSVFAVEMQQLVPIVFLLKHT